MLLNLFSAGRVHISVQRNSSTASRGGVTWCREGRRACRHSRRSTLRPSVVKDTRSQAPQARRAAESQHSPPPSLIGGRRAAGSLSASASLSHTQRELCVTWCQRPDLFGRSKTRNGSGAGPYHPQRGCSGSGSGRACTAPAGPGPLIPAIRHGPRRRIRMKGARQQQLHRQSSSSSFVILILGIVEKIPARSLPCTAQQRSRGAANIAKDPRPRAFPLLLKLLGKLSAPGVGDDEAVRTEPARSFPHLRQLPAPPLGELTSLVARELRQLHPNPGPQPPALTTKPYSQPRNLDCTTPSSQHVASWRCAAASPWRSTPSSPVAQPASSCTHPRHAEVTRRSRGGQMVTRPQSEIEGMRSDLRGLSVGDAEKTAALAVWRASRRWCRRPSPALALALALAGGPGSSFKFSPLALDGWRPPSLRPRIARVPAPPRTAPEHPRPPPRQLARVRLQAVACSVSRSMTRGTLAHKSQQAHRQTWAGKRTGRHGPGRPQRPLLRGKARRPPLHPPLSPRRAPPCQQPLPRRHPRIRLLRHLLRPPAHAHPLPLRGAVPPPPQCRRLRRPRRPRLARGRPAGCRACAECEGREGGRAQGKSDRVSRPSAARVPRLFAPNRCSVPTCAAL